MKDGRKVAIVCDWLVGTGGAERVVLELHKMFPDAPIYTSQYNPDPKIWHGGKWFKSADVRTGWLQRLPLALRKFLPVLRAIYFSRLDLSDYDLVISSSGAEAKAVKTGTKTVHISYCHSPTHYYWVRYDEYLTRPGFGWLDPLARLGLKLLVGPLRAWDFKAAQKPNFLIANSHHTQEMIKRFYGRDSVVIHPPVDIDRFKASATEPRQGFVTAGRQTPYMRFDLAIEVANQLSLPLIVIGNGPDHRRLRRMAGRSVTFLRGKSDEEVAHYFKTSLAFIQPGMVDFGIVAVEALAAGTPVIAYGEGGVLDYIEPGKNGELFKPQDAAALADCLRKFDPSNYGEKQIRLSAAAFGPKSFEGKVQSFIKGVI